jgi:putative phosphoribosyl transferase
MKTTFSAQTETDLHIDLESVSLKGDLVIPPEPRGLVLFAHGSGSGRRSSRNRFVAGILRRDSIGTLLFDLLTEEEEEVDRRTSHLRFDIRLLAERLIRITQWVRKDHVDQLPLGYFGASTGAAAALIAAAHFGSWVSAVVSRGGRPDLAGDYLKEVIAPTLLIVGGRDTPVIQMNSDALLMLQCPKQLEIIPGATHLFEEPGTLEKAARLASTWFAEHFAQTSAGQLGP